jgi:Subtilisin inhibitor-like
MAMTYTRVVTRWAPIGGCALVLAACGSVAAPGTGTSGTSPPPKATLHVVESKHGAQPRTHWTLQCDPPGGTAPNAAAACRLLLADTSILHPVRRPQVMCPMIMVDARTFTITGNWYGTKVHVHVVDGGCDLGRWAKLSKIFN